MSQIADDVRIDVSEFTADMTGQLLTDNDVAAGDTVVIQTLANSATLATGAG